MWPEGYDRVHLPTVDSTMAEAVRRAPNLTRPTWIMADEQTAGRGRQGRNWTSQPGNLMATLVYRPKASPAEAAQRSFMAANALFEALALHLDRARLSQKWPNDVLLNGGKVAGILLESSGAGNQVDWLAIGVGVNLAHAPQMADALFPPVSVIGEGGPTLDPAMFLTELASNFATEEAVLRELGFAKIRQTWLRHAARLGDVITARTTRGEITGTFDSIDEEGNLVLITGVGPQVISAADVYF